MRPEKALQIVRSIGTKRRRVIGRARSAATSHPVYAVPPLRRWTWESATPHEKGAWVRSTRALGIMDWDLCDLFNLTRKGLAAIVRGQDWNETFVDQQREQT